MALPNLLDTVFPNRKKPEDDPYAGIAPQTDDQGMSSRVPPTTPITQTVQSVDPYAGIAPVDTNPVDRNITDVQPQPLSPDASGNAFPLPQMSGGTVYGGAPQTVSEKPVARNITDVQPQPTLPQIAPQISAPTDQSLASMSSGQTMNQPQIPSIAPVTSSDAPNAVGTIPDNTPPIAKKHHGLLARLGEGALQGFASGGIGGAIMGAGLNSIPALDRRVHEREDAVQAQEQRKAAQEQANIDYTKARTATIPVDDARQAQSAADLAALRNARTRKQDADIEHQRLTDKAAGDKWDKFENNGMLYEKHADGKTVPWIDPVTGKQGISQIDIPQTANVPGTTDKVSVTGAQKLTNATNLAVGDANRDVQVQTTNANNQLRVLRDNQQSKTQAIEKNLQMRIEAIKAQASVLGSNQEVSTAADQMGANATAIRDLADEFNNKLENGELTQTEADRLQKEIRGRYDNQFKLQKNVDAAIGRTKGGADLVKQLNQMSVPIPKDLAVPKVTGHSVSKPVSKKNDPLGLFQ